MGEFTQLLEKKGFALKNRQLRRRPDPA